MNQPNYETFFAPAEVTFSFLDDKPKIGGRIPYEVLGQRVSSFKERLKRTAFSRSLTSDREVRALFNHDWSQVMARRSTGTLRLTDTEDGCLVEIEPNNTSWSRDAIECVKSKDSKGFSFGLYITDDAWSKQDDGTIVRDILDGDLYEVSVVFDPAFTRNAQIDCHSADAEISDYCKDKLKQFWTPSLSIRERQQKLLRTSLL